MAKTAGERASGEKAKRPVAGPRPAYMLYTVDEDGNVQVQSVERKAEQLLKLKDEHPDWRYVRFMLK